MAEKKKYGQYFTPQQIADFMVSLIQKPLDCRVLEPSCGKGVFLHSLLERGYHNLTAYEIDKQIEVEYDFVKYESFVSSSTDEKFDVVIGNPPYIRWKNLEPELKEEVKHNNIWRKYFNCLCDYHLIFILKSVEQLVNGGELIFICTEYWLNTTHSKALRKYLSDNGYFSDIYHFKESPLFQDVTASFIIFRYVKTNNVDVEKNINLHLYTGKGKPSFEDLISNKCFNKLLIPQFGNDDRWILATENTQQEVKEFEAKCSIPSNIVGEEMNRIGDYFEIGNGMVSGLDAAFKFSPEEGHMTDEEKSGICKVLKAKDLVQYSYKHISYYILLPNGLKEEDFVKYYPNFKRHFEPFIDKLNNRYNYNKNIPYWEFVFPRNKKLFDRREEKIFIPCKERISNKNYFRFALAPVGVYPLQDVTGIVKKACCRESIEYVLAYLNNKRVYKWLVLNGIVKGDIVEFSETPLSRIPYRIIDWNNEHEVSLHNKITDEVRKYIEDKENIHIDRINKYFNILFYESNDRF